MYPELKELLYDAEDHYLQETEIYKLRSYVDSMQIRLAIYKHLRNQEINLFQEIANQLEKELTQKETPQIEKAIINWAGILRYLAMAMLLNSQEFLERRILEWLNPSLEAHQAVSINKRVYQMLYSRLQGDLDKSQWTIIQPFLQGARNTLFESSTTLSGGNI